MTCGTCTHFQDEMTEADGFTHGYGRMRDEHGLHDKGRCRVLEIWKWSNDLACDDGEDGRKQGRLL